MATFQQLVPGAGFVHEDDTSEQLAPGGFVNTTASSGSTLALDSGTYTLTGQNVGLYVTRYLGINSGSYTLTGQAVGITISRVLPLDSGTYTLTGSDVALSVGKPPIVLDSGSYTLTGGDVGLIISRVLTLDAGGYFLDGQTLQLTKSGGGAIAWPMSRGHSTASFGGYMVFGGDDLPPITPPNPTQIVPLTSSAGMFGSANFWLVFPGETPPGEPDATGQVRALCGGGMSVTATSERSGSGVIALEAMMDTVPTPSVRTGTVAANGGGRAGTTLIKEISKTVSGSGGAMLYAIQSTSTQGGVTTSASASVFMNGGAYASLSVNPDKSSYVYAYTGGSGVVAGVQSLPEDVTVTAISEEVQRLLNELLPQIGPSVLATTVESGLTFKNAQRAIFSATAGNSFGMKIAQNVYGPADLVGYRSFDGNRTRVTVKFDAQSNRIVQSYDFND